MEAEEIRNISVIGAGMMGHGIAQIFATQGFHVMLSDINENVLTQALENIRSNLHLMAQKGIGHRQRIEPSIRRIKTTVDLEEAIAEAQFVFEAVSENLALKQKTFQDMDRLSSPETILATNTSVMSITEIAQKSSRRERIIGTHFWYPPYLIPLVEVVKGADTSPRVMDVTFDLLKIAGKQPIRIHKDVPGFVCNRLQHALWREAVSIVEKGIADAETVDEAVKSGFGIRLPVLGPLENADMVGLDLTLAIHEYIFKHIEWSSKPSPILKKRWKKETLASRQERDSISGQKRGAKQSQKIS
jgi:3-hydroxybutyryl-CoA dehydrogenase